LEKVLVVEDDDMTRMLMKRVIDKLGFETIAASNGREGLALFDEHQTKIVVTDIRMPEIDGLELLHTVKRRNPAVEVILVTAHGDYDTAIHALREGAADYLRKPIDLAELESALTRCEHRLVESERIHVKPTILLVEDDAFVLKRLARVLEKEGWKAITADSGESALQQLDRTRVDVVVTDLRMPGMSGLDLLHAIKQEALDCEVIVITGYGDETTAVRAMKEGALNYIRKPIDLDQFILSIEKAFEQLKLKRHMLFRTRELELAREIIVKITRDSRVLVNVADDSRQPTKDYAKRLLNNLPLGLLVISPDANVVYSTPYMVEFLGYEPKQLDEALATRLNRLGIPVSSTEGLRDVIERLYKHPPQPEDTVRLGEDAYLFATRFTLLGDECVENAVVLVVKPRTGEHVPS
jgi:DNA-binding NtrC family response regulator